MAAVLRRDDPDAVWECSHIGGDRFAATMLLMPHGINLRIDAYEPIQSGRMTERSWEVLLADPPGQVRVELAQTHTEPVYSNCAATVALPRPAFTVRSVIRTR